MKYTQNEKLSIYNGLASTISTNAVNGYIPLLAISVLEATNQQMGLISSLPSIIGLLAIIPGAVWINRSRSKKRVAVASTFATRFLFMLILFVPFLPKEYAPWFLVGLIGLLNFPGAVSGLSWQSMIGDLVPEKRRGDFFSTRNRLNTIAAMFITFGTGFFLQQYDQGSPFPYQFLFVLGFLFALLEVYYLFKHKESPVIKEKPEEGIKTKKLSLAVFRHKPFLTFVVCGLLFNFGAQMAWSIFSIYQIKEAGATALWLSLFSVTNQLAQIVSIKWWAKAADRKGNSFILFIAAAGMATAPLLTVASSNLVYLTLINLWIGLFVSGTNLLLFNQLLNASPEKNRTSYIANYNFLSSLVGFIAPQFGVFLLDHFGMLSAMSITSAVRFAAALSFLFAALTLERKKMAAAI
ncbi:Permeases of the major facilitator superfamily protein [Bacillus sp. NRRL B-14911]|uniref:MFS transporter n=1 Tax=Bacillus infantis NRRL B-14911 TaxID=1367477 RepID=U5L941_9BACI|nr:MULTISPECIES: MFS transporter [Bacillus]AGX04354.1 MFS transporter [Bacillus infantis NRRL B-14911]EAR66944.1 Permeases of the major facilitator superfamily protein [Bacillus sp. NRRL B-14911]